MQLPGALFSPTSKISKHLPRKNFLYFRKWNFPAPRLKNFLYFWKSNLLASYFSYISGSNFPGSRDKKNPTLKKCLIFRDMELPSTKLKSRSVVNVGRSVRKKHLRVKKSSPKSLALTVQQHKNKLSDKKAAKLVTWKQWKHPKNSGKNQWWKMKTPEKAIMKNLIFSGAFYLTVLPDIWHNLLLSRLPWESAVLPWRLQDLPMRFETQSRSICLCESHSVQQKILIGRFYLCVTALRIAISTSYRFWTHSSIATYIVKRMSYRQGHRGSYWILVYIRI